MKIKRICCIGAGYVGGPTMAVIAHECPEIRVVVVDSDTDKINAWNSKDLNNLPVYEPGLSDIVKVVRNRNLFFTNDFDNSIIESEMIFMAVNTPTKKSGVGRGFAADLSNVEKCAKRIAIKSRSNKIIVEKSPLPVKTAEKIKEVLSEFNTHGVTFEVLSNPEFLAEGTAIKDLYKSDRVLIGGDSTQRGKKAVNCLVNIYKRWIPEKKIIKTSVWSSELSKLASNAMLAQRISSINSLSAICENTDASINELSRAIGTDSRIGNKFLETSVGFGGSCFQKDILNLVYLSKSIGLNEVAEYWHQVVKINDYQKLRFSKKIIDFFNGNVSNAQISILGWAYKKNTNDSRESSSIFVTRDLLDRGAKVKIYDPMVSKTRIIKDISDHFKKNQVKRILDNVQINNSINQSISNSKVIVILTEWDEFKNFNWKKRFVNSKSAPFIFDGRNIINNYYTNKIYSIGN